MAEYIKREDAIFPDDVYGYRDKQIINKIPSADVVEVRHGKWELHGEPPWYVIECSKCGEKWHHWQGYSMPNFCSNCGSRMDGE